MQRLSQQQIERWITTPRFSAFLNETNNDVDSALALYDWNVCMSAVFFELVSYSEVILRNAIDAQFQPMNHAEMAQNSWLADPALLNQRSIDEVLAAEQRLGFENKSPTRARVVAGLSFGFWRALINKQYKQLWISHLHPAFPNGTGDRSEVSKLLARINPFRNRLAHHDPIIRADVSARHDDLLELVGLIDHDAADWLARRSAVPDILAWRPPLTRGQKIRASLGSGPDSIRFHQRLRSS